MKRCIQVAMFCWAVPLVAGVAIFLGWQRADLGSAQSVELMRCGIGNLLFGSAAFFVGTAAVANYCLHARRAAVPPARVWLCACVMQLMLLSNFVVAGRIILTAADSELGLKPPQRTSL